MSGPSKKMLVVTMPDGSKWAVAAEAIAHDRATYYEGREPGSYQNEYDYDELLQKQLATANERIKELEATLKPQQCEDCGRCHTGQCPTL